MILFEIQSPGVAETQQSHPCKSCFSAKKLLYLFAQLHTDEHPRFMINASFFPLGCPTAAFSTVIVVII
uniref:Uncharacterized protein n=1 Tax=Anguilla anguilla TaxID=7936 RepID=A0A0E9VSB4_ANGAN